LFRDRTLAANFPGPYQRHNFAGNLGAPIVRDKLFFFVNAEHYKQDLGFPVQPPPPLDVLSAVVDEPFRESILSGRLDYNAPKGLHLFYRFNYDNIKTVGAFQPTFSIQREVNNAPRMQWGRTVLLGALAQHPVRIRKVPGSLWRCHFTAGCLPSSAGCHAKFRPPVSRGPGSE